MTEKEPAQTEKPTQAVAAKKKKKWPWIVGGIVLLFIIIGATGSGNQSQKVGDDKTQNGNTTVDTKTPSTKTYKVGDQVKLGDNVVTVYSVVDYKSSNEFMKPQSGKKYVVADIGIQNGGKEAINYNTFDFKLQDNKDYSYDSSFSDKSPSFSSGALQPGQKTRGFITYEVDTANTASKVIFTPSFWSDEQIIFEI